MTGTFRSQAFVAISLAVCSATVALAQSRPPVSTTTRPAGDRISRRNPPANRPVDPRIRDRNAVVLPPGVREVGGAVGPTAQPVPGINYPDAATTRPVAGAAGRAAAPADFAYLAPVKELLFAEPASWESAGTLETLELFVVAGDSDDAKRVLGSWKGFYRPFASGILAAYSEEPTLATAKRLCGPTDPNVGAEPVESEMIRGLFIGLARQGQEKPAASIMKSAAPYRQPALQVRLARYFPSPENLDAMTSKLDPRQWQFGRYTMADCAIAFAAAGEDRKVHAVLDEFKRISPPGKFDEAAIRMDVARAYLRLGNPDEAKEVLKPLSDYAWRDELEPAFLIPWAVAGNTAALDRAINDSTVPRGYGLPNLFTPPLLHEKIADLGVYALARAGSIDQAKKLAGKRLQYLNRIDGYSFRLGLIAHAQAAGGDQDAARKTLEEAVASIAKLEQPEARKAAAMQLLRPAILGADTYAYDKDLYDMWSSVLP